MNQVKHWHWIAEETYSRYGERTSSDVLASSKSQSWAMSQTISWTQVVPLFGQNTTQHKLLNFRVLITMLMTWHARNWRLRGVCHYHSWGRWEPRHHLLLAGSCTASRRWRQLLEWLRIRPDESAPIRPNKMETVWRTRRLGFAARWKTWNWMASSCWLKEATTSVLKT